MNTRLHAIADANGRPMRFFMTAGQVKWLHRRGRAAARPAKAQWLLGNRGYDADWFGEVHPGSAIARRTG